MSESSTKSALVAAILTGVFTVIAGLVTYYVTTKEPELTYSVIGSPALSSQIGVKRIFVAEVVNTGRKEIGDVLTRVAVPGGELGDVAYETSPGIKVARVAGKDYVELKADMLNQGDFVKISFLASGISPALFPSVVVRAPGVRGTLKKTANEQSSWSKATSWLSLGAGALAAVASTFALSTGTWLGRKIGSGVLNTSLEQAEVSAFICGACLLPTEAERLRFGSHISYRGTADYLFLRSRSEQGAKRMRYAIALRCLLLIKHISPTSIGTIRKSIELIEGRKFTDDQFNDLRRRAVSEGDRPLQWRTTVMSFAEAEMANLE